MKYIYSNGQYQVFDDSVQTFDRLPAATYRIGFDKMQGFFLMKDYDIVVNEKVYGDHTRKSQKVINTFEKFDRNLGVLLSGNKGMGKSLVCKMICEGMMKKGYPVIVVSSYIPGIADYLHKIDCEAVIFLDEFDKLFHQNVEDYDNDSNRPQDEMLSLFDGSDVNKKMFLVTCNKISDISEYFLNRPGRFHYHFRFLYPRTEEIEEYLNDNVKEQYHNEIINVVAFAQKVRLNYDCLRSIAFELNQGEKFVNFIDDMNIINLGNEVYDIEVVTNKQTLFGKERLDIFSSDPQRVFLEGNDRGMSCRLDMSQFEYDEDEGALIPTNKDAYIFDNDMKDKIKSFKIKESSNNIFSYLT